jgi:DNA-binding transcriptional MerR regulator
MQQPALVIPDKLFFKIGEVCDIVGVQPHVLRYWESEFPMLQPQKNRAGQRTYRRKDVEMALRIRELLYEEGFTIAGAKRKLLGEGRGGSSRLQIVPPGGMPSDEPEAPPPPPEPEPPPQISRLSRDTIKRLKVMAEELLTTLKRDVKK